MSVRKRDWKTKDGEVHTGWVETYRDAAGKQRQGGTYALKRDADAADARIKVELQKGVHRPVSTSPTVSEIEPHWVDRATTDRLETVYIENFQRDFRLHIEPTLAPPDALNRWDGKLGDLKVAKLTPPMCETFKRVLLKTPLRNGRGDIIEGKLISLVRAKAIFGNFKALLREAQRQNVIAINPAATTTIKISNRDRVPLRIGIDIPDRGDIRALLLASTGMWHVFILTAALTGMRWSELCALPWDNVDLDGHVVHVWQRADRKGVIGKCKSGSGYRDIPIPDILVAELRRWKLICPASDLNLVFPSLRGKMLSYQKTRSEMWVPLQERVGMTRPATRRPDGKHNHKYSLHGLRHFYASLMIDKGVAPKKLQARMGHRSLQMTMDLYGHLFATSKDEAAQINDAAASVWAAE